MNSGKKVNQQLPRINAQRGESDGVNPYHRQYMINQKRQNPEIIRTHMKNKSVSRPSSREISGMFSHRDRMQQDSYAGDSYRTEKLTSIDESSKWEKSIRKEGQNIIEGLVKHQSVPLLKVQSLGYDKKFTQRIRLQKQIASIEESSPIPFNGKLRRSRTTGEPSRERSRERASAGEMSTENPNVSPERAPEAYSSPFILEGIKPVNLEQKVFPAGLKNPLPYWMNPNLSKAQEEIQENLRKAGFRRSLATINPGVRVINETLLPFDILMERSKLPLSQNNNNLNNQPLISGREEKLNKQQPAMSMEIASAGLPSAGGLASNYNSNEQPRKLQRALSDIKNKNFSHFEDSSPLPDPHEGRSFSAAKLRPKFRSQEAILNKLFNRKK